MGHAVPGPAKDEDSQRRAFTEEASLQLWLSLELLLELRLELLNALQRNIRRMCRHIPVEI